ncbi:MAG TPA: hypothetical protein VFL66_10315 [Gaiellaceae bacterium]|nr:hypothetical protein [Gaiellaceae bacterium]
MNTQIATESAPARSRRSVRARVVASLGPLTAAVGVAWGVLQPWRVTLLHPAGQGFWWLLAEPPLLVVAAGIAFALLVAPGLVADLEDTGR